LNIKYIFKSGRKLRLNSENEYPKDFFYGYEELSKKGFNIEILEEKDFGITKKITFKKRCINVVSKLIGDFPLIHFLTLIKSRNLKLLNNTDIIIVTTYSLGLTLGTLNTFGFLKKPVIFIVMGLIPLKGNVLKKIFCKIFLKRISITCISKNEQNYLKTFFPKKIISYIPFGVDKNFWKTNNNNKKNDFNYVLAIGNDYARDWDTLINAWRSDFPDLKLITSLPVKTNKKNINLLRGNWGDESLKDKEILELYLNASFVIIPLKETIQPSGQSCCLQAMACAKPVIISKTKGIWDKDLLKHKENLIFVKPNSKDELRNSILNLINDKDLYEKLSHNGRVLIENNFNTEQMAYYLEQLIIDVNIN
tara:strand:+ start:7213 stop:8307 length:1095 start_codon:yes stop_codon:yes gene_type:complete